VRRWLYQEADAGLAAATDTHTDAAKKTADRDSRLEAMMWLAIRIGPLRCAGLDTRIR
jgi:hypothetical protein